VVEGDILDFIYSFLIINVYLHNEIHLVSGESLHSVLRNALLIKCTTCRWS